MTTEENPEQQPESEGMASLRQSRDEAATRAAELEQQVAQYQRRDALAGAGLDMSNPVHSFFAEKYDGEASADAVKAAWEASGLGQLNPDAQPAPSTPQPTPVDVAGGISQAFGGDASPAGVPQVADPMDEAREAYQDARNRGVPEENAMEAVVQGVINGALQELDGHRQAGRFVFDREAFHASIGR